MIKYTSKEVQELVDTLYRVICQACISTPLPDDKDQTRKLDSQFLGAYADGMRLLGRYNRIKLLNDVTDGKLVEAEDIDSVENMP